MALVGMQEVCWGFGGPPLLENIALQIEKGQRIGLVGRNGAGKSTLLKIIHGDIVPDSGKIQRAQNLTVALLGQEVYSRFEGTVFDAMAATFGRMGQWLCELRRLPNVNDIAGRENTSGRQAYLQQQLDYHDGWEVSNRIQRILTQIGMDPEIPFENLSAGAKRKVLLASVFAREPELLLLDEPTNHLDIDTIVWAEAFLQRYVKSVVFITHDRAFLKRLANRILELDRGRLVAYDCDYRRYLERREAALAAEERQQRRFDKQLSQEEDWIRKGIKARRTRNEGRVRSLMKMRQEFRERRQKIGQVRFQVQEARRTGRLVIEADSLGIRYGDRWIVREFSTVILRGDKVGIVGPNGAGKTTLINLLLKQKEPDRGTVRHGTHIQAAYFDQLRGQLDEQASVAQNIGRGNDTILVNGEQRHVIGYLQEFLFSPRRSRTPVRVLSGGEKNRLLLAKLFTRPFNLLILDEPTNDLDTETLELLEELLVQFKGTLLLVSHDRTFLNHVVTSTVVFEGDGRVAEYAGGYDDWLAQRPEALTEKAAAASTVISKGDRQRPKPRKLGYLQQRELEALPSQIDALEEEQSRLYGTLSSPELYKTPNENIASVKRRLEELELQIEAAWRRWEELETIGNDGKGAGSW